MKLSRIEELPRKRQRTLRCMIARRNGTVACGLQGIGHEYMLKLDDS